MNNESEINPVYEELLKQRAQNSQLKAALRKHAVHDVLYGPFELTYPGRCDECKSEWTTLAEKHKPGCLADELYDQH